MKEIGLPTVTRIHTERGSHIEPELDTGWTEAEKLAWHAAVIAHDTGLTIRLHDEAFTINGEPVPGMYGINVGSHSLSAYTYREAWTFLNGVDTGAAVAKEAN